MEYCMAIKTSTFSGWRLSGEDAIAFIKQVEEPTINQNAIKAVEQGRKLAEEYIFNGYVSIDSLRTQ